MAADLQRRLSWYDEPMVAEPALSNFALKDEIAAYWSARAASFDASPGHGIAPGAERSAWMELVGS